MNGSNESLRQSDRQIVAEQRDLNLRSLLRLATHHHHEHLNQHPLLAGLLMPNSPRENYQKLLLAYFQIFQHLESKINDFLFRQPCAFDYAERCKLPWLLKDLAFFDTDPQRSKQVTSDKLTWLKIDNVGQLIGVLYTVEGSTLGGQFVSRRLADHYGFTPTAGACFFHGYGDQTIPMWQAFICFSESIDENKGLRNAAEKAACQTFQLFHQVLDDYIPAECCGDQSYV
jgi:heme oxygenase